MKIVAKSGIILPVVLCCFLSLAPQAAEKPIAKEEPPTLTAGIASVLAEYAREAREAEAVEQEPEEQQSETEEPEAWNAEEEYMLAKIAMAEAEDQDTEGKALVICVVLNRVDSDRFPDSVKEVLFEPKQFTPILDGRWYHVEPDADCYAALQMVENGWDQSAGATYFELTNSAATWHSTNLQKVLEHGDTTFYKEKD